MKSSLVAVSWVDQKYRYNKQRQVCRWELREVVVSCRSKCEKFLIQSPVLT